MNERELFKYAVDSFIGKLCSTTGRTKISYRCNDADIRAWKRWIEKYGSLSVGREWIDKWIDWAMASWFNSSTVTDYSHTIRLSWVFGNTAIKRWESVDAGLRASVIRKNKTNRKRTVKIKDLLSYNVAVGVRDVEEAAKRLYYNTKRGLLWCVANTTLYNHRSSLCLGCVYKKECKQCLSENYPNVYKTRGYSNAKQ